MKKPQRTQPMSPNGRRVGRAVVLAAIGIALATALSAFASDTTTSTMPGSGRSSNDQTGSTTGAAADGTIDPCSLLSEVQLSQIIGAAVTVDGPAVEVARGRTCTYSFQESGNTVFDEGTIDITAWHGAEFFAAGTPGSGIGADAQDDSTHGVVIFRDGEEVVQVHVLSPEHRQASLEIARAADSQVSRGSRLT